MYALTISLNHKENLLKCIPKYNWDSIEFPAAISEYKTFEKNNGNIALNVLCNPFDTEEIRPEYISKFNYTCKNQVTLLKITDDKGTWHFLALKSEPAEDGYMRPTKDFSRLMKNISSMSNENYYCMVAFIHLDVNLL